MIRVTGVKKIEVGKTSAPQWLLNLTLPIEVLVKNLTRALGQPVEIQTSNLCTVDFSQIVPIVSSSPPEDSVTKPGSEQESNKSSSCPTTSATSRVSFDLLKQTSGSSMYMPLKALNTFARDWKIQARIASKSEKRTTNKGGSLLKIGLVDMYGTQIEGTFFNEAADLFDPRIKENHVYLFSNGCVKMANKKFTSIKNDFCIVFEKNAFIMEVEDDGSIAAQAYDFCDIANIQDV